LSSVSVFCCYVVDSSLQYLYLLMKFAALVTFISLMYASEVTKHSRSMCYKCIVQNINFDLPKFQHREIILFAVISIQHFSVNCSSIVCFYVDVLRGIWTVTILIHQVTEIFQEDFVGNPSSTLPAKMWLLKRNISGIVWMFAAAI